MSRKSESLPESHQLSRRTVLRWSGAGLFTALTNGFFASLSLGAPSTKGSAQSGSWSFDSKLGLFAQPLVSTGVAIAWEFNTNRDAKGRQAINGMSPFIVSGGMLRTTVIGFDPFISVPPVRLIGRRDRQLRMRAKGSGGGGRRFALYFMTEESPKLSGDKMIVVDLPLDGEFHELMLDLGAAHQQWMTGTVTMIRLDIEPGGSSEGTELEIDYIRIERLAARLSATTPTLSLGSIRPGEEFELATTVRNLGGEASAAFPVQLTLPEGVMLTAGDTVANVPALAPNAEVTLSWIARVSESVPGAVTIDLAAPGGAFRFGAVVPAVPDAKLLQDWSPSGVKVFRDSSGHIYLQNADVRIVFLSGRRGFTQALLGVRASERWRLLASSQPLTWICVQTASGPELLPVVPDKVRLVAGNRSQVILNGEVKDAAGTRWSVELSYSLGADDVFVRASYTATPDHDSDLLAFRGPSLTAGERSFGSVQDMALFPGLEWLVAGERSSGTLDVLPPHHLRSTPSPFKVTVPLMAVLQDGGLVSLQWDTNQAWDGNRRHPTPRFASPNWIEGQANHALTLFVPDIPELVDENAPWATAAPYSAVAGRPLQVRAELVAEVTGDVLRAIDHWYAVHGLPEPADKPFSWEQELALIRHAYVTSYWVPDIKGWPHVYGGKPQPFVPYAAVLQIAGLLATNPAEQQAAFDRVREFVDNVLVLNGPGALGDLSGGSIRMFHAPFYLGHLEGALPHWQKQIAVLLAGQKSDGSWRFDPGNSSVRRQLGELGAEGLGLTAVPAQLLLRYARLTGDARALDAGLRALTYMGKFNVPRAAQTWEVPVHSPDVLASAYGVGSFVEGYRLTGNPEYLRRAEYWARTGLPFLSAWTDPERPMLPYASVPVFGATSFLMPWFGRAVQWNGLVFAYFLLDLLEAAGPSLNFPWQKLAEGLVVSAMYQQRTEEPAKGGYPDVWDLRENFPGKNMDINPELVAKPAIMLMGYPTDVQTVLLQRAGKVVQFSTAAAVSNAAWGAEDLSATLRFYDGATSQLMVVGLPTSRGVVVDGRALVEVAHLDSDDVVEGWKRLGDKTLLIKLRHAAESKLTVIF
ncbi:hypothetical protein [Azotobacter salinestris]|uniref:hypothetical protein n=1 Tax=Azotobacter salinestris TaxID=69964 RepID=UPI001AD6929C|nr:hypothetical protein [Azotobacter salinestris]